MEDWSENFVAILEQMSADVEQFFQDMGEIVEVVSEEVHNSIAIEIEHFWQDFWEPLVDIYTEFDLEVNPDWDDFTVEEESYFVYKVDSNRENHPACQGCRHYHGQVYNNNLLVCGMHPYGWDDEHCPDWES